MCVLLDLPKVAIYIENLMRFLAGIVWTGS
jgi:hypothetical protein